MSDLFDLDAPDDSEPFEVDRQAAHLFKHPRLGFSGLAATYRRDRDEH